MKTLFLFIITVFISSSTFAQNENSMSFRAEIIGKPKDYIASSDYIIIEGYKRTLIKKIKIDKDGIFKGTIKNVKPGIYNLWNGNQLVKVFLKNGFDLTLKMNTDRLNHSVVYTGKGAPENNFIKTNNQYTIENFNKIDSLKTLGEDHFLEGIEKLKKTDLKDLNEAKLDPAFVYCQRLEINHFYKQSVKSYMDNYDIIEIVNNLENDMLPSFNYKNSKGGETKLEDFSGKYVYLVVWMTWEEYSNKEVLELKKLEEKYRDKNIAFVSICMDSDKNHSKWKAFISENKLEGHMLFADQQGKSKFASLFKIMGRPSFFLIDPDGYVLKKNAKRATDPELQNELDLLLN